MSSSDLIDLADDVDEVPAQPRSSAVEVVLNDERPCAQCQQLSSSGDMGKVVRVMPCGHSTHIKCSKDQRCPVCSAQMTWKTLAHGTSKAEFYGLRSTTSAPEDKPVQTALGALLTAFGDAVAMTPSVQKKTKAKAKPRGRGRGQVQQSVSSGVGYAGSANERGVSVHALEQSRKRQQTEDLRILDLLNKFSKALSTRLDRPSTLELECILRTKGTRVSLISFYFAYLRNGASDVCSRSPLYVALLQLLVSLSKNEQLCSILCDSTEFSSDGKVEQPDAESELLRGVVLLGEGLRGLVQSGDANAGQLLNLTEDIKQNTLNSVRTHPHFDFSQVEILVKQGRLRQRRKKDEFERICSDPSSTPADLSKAYERALGEFQFRTISLVDLCVQNMSAHTFVRVNPQSGQAVITAHQTNPLTFLPGMPVAAATPSRNIDPQRMARVHKELSNLKSSLPLTWGSSVFAVCDETRMDVIQFMIVGPEDTPYQNGLFVFDCLLGDNFPTQAPSVRLQTTGGGRVRFNPNLYKDGKVCLSLLGTWNGPGWDPKTSSLLQVIVSIQSLIMVNDPYFNEPGWESQRNQPTGILSSNVYNAHIRYQTMRLAMLEMIKNPPYAFRDVVRLHFAAKKREITQQLQKWRAELQQLQNTIATQRIGFATFQVFDSGTAGPVDLATFDRASSEVLTAMTQCASKPAKSVAVGETVELLDDSEAVAADVKPAKKARFVPEGEVVDLLRDDAVASSSTAHPTAHQIHQQLSLYQMGLGQFFDDDDDDDEEFSDYGGFYDSPMLFGDEEGNY